MSVTMIVSDWLIGFVNPTPLGTSRFIFEGTKDMALWRPVLSLMIAAVAFTVYLLPLRAMRNTITDHKL